jgi:hypothetical protein
MLNTLFWRRTLQKQANVSPVSAKVMAKLPHTMKPSKALLTCVPRLNDIKTLEFPNHDAKPQAELSERCVYLISTRRARWPHKHIIAAADFQQQDACYFSLFARKTNGRERGVDIHIKNTHKMRAHSEIHQRARATRASAR